MAKRVVDPAKTLYRRIRKGVVSMRIHALGKRAMAQRGNALPEEISFYSGQHDAMVQMLQYLDSVDPSQKKRAATKPRKR